MKILSWNIHDGGAQDIRKYDKVGNSNTDFEYGVMYKNNNWNQKVLNKAGLSEQDIINNVKSIAEEIMNKKPDIVILQEFEYQYKDFLFPYFDKYDIKYNPDLEKKIARNGVLIATKLPLKIEVLNTNVEWPYSYKYHRRNFLEAKIDDYYFLGVHVHGYCEKGKKKEDIIKDINIRNFFWSKIIDFSNRNKSKTFIIGDFNTAEGEIDKEKFSPNWIDLGEEENIITYKNKYKENRIDYIFCSSDLQDKNKKCNLQVIQTELSDHDILFLDVNNI